MDTIHLAQQMSSAALLFTGFCLHPLHPNIHAPLPEEPEVLGLESFWINEFKLRLALANTNSYYPLAHWASRIRDDLHHTATPAQEQSSSTPTWQCAVLDRRDDQLQTAKSLD